MVVAANDLGDAHVPVVHHHAEVVSRGAVSPGDDEVVQFGVADFDTALDQIIPSHHPAGGVLETDHRLHAGRDGGQGLAGLRAPAAVITRLITLGALGFADLLQFFGRGVAVIGRTGLQHLLDHFLVTVDPLHLIEGAFVVGQTQPVHAVNDGLHSLRGGARHIRILDAQHEFPPVAAGVGPGEEGGTGAANVQVAGGAGGETGTNHGV